MGHPPLVSSRDTRVGATRYLRTRASPQSAGYRKLIRSLLDNEVGNYNQKNLRSPLRDEATVVIREFTWLSVAEEGLLKW